jgi:hypothetical protein
MHSVIEDLSRRIEVNQRAGRYETCVGMERHALPAMSIAERTGLAACRKFRQESMGYCVRSRTAAG